MVIRLLQGRSKHERRTSEISYEDWYTREISRFVCNICNDEQNFKFGFSTVAVVQLVRRWSSGHRLVQAEGSSPGGDMYQFFFSNDFYFSFVRSSERQ